MYNIPQARDGTENKPTTGTEGIWTFVFIDMVIFLLIFFSYMSERLRHLNQYMESQKHLNEFFGLSNTLVLLTSSWLVVEAVNAARNANPNKVKLYLWSAWALGAAFGINKIIEYHDKFASGITPISNSFFSYYFFITIVHFLHVLAGMLCIYIYSRRASECASSERIRYQSGIENVGLFWHYVDVLWIFIFPLLYLVGRT